MTQIPQAGPSSRGNGLIVFVLFGLLIALVIGSLALGRYPVPVGEILRVLLTTRPFGATGSYTDPNWVMVEIVRLPRILEVTLWARVVRCGHARRLPQSAGRAGGLRSFTRGILRRRARHPVGLVGVGDRRCGLSRVLCWHLLLPLVWPPSRRDVVAPSR